MSARTGLRRLVGYLLVARQHPRHLVLFALVAGLLAGPVAPAAAVTAAGVAAWVAGRIPLAVLAAAAALAGATLAQARVEALGPGELSALAGRSIETRAILLEPVRQRANGSAVARVRLVGRATIGAAPGAGGAAGADAAAAPHEGGAADAGAVADAGGVADADAAMDAGGAVDEGGAARGRLQTDQLAGEAAVARAADGRPPPGARVGSELRIAAQVVPLGEIDAFQRRRGAHVALEVAAWSATGAARGRVAGRLDAARERAARGLGEGLGASEAALLRGMVLGQDEAIPQAVRDDFRRSGLAHLLAVSGQNVLLLCALAIALCSVADVPLRGRLILAAVLVALYVPLAGGGPSIQRAGVMGIAGLVAAMAGRPASRWYALGLAAAVTLALNPLAAGDPGWQLSFAAVVGLLALAPRLRDALTRRRVPGPLADVAAVTIAATLATAPLAALHFEQVSLASLPANLLAAIVVAPVMWLGMLGIVVAQLASPLALPLNVACAPLLGYLEWVAHVTASAPLAAVPVRLGGAAGLALAFAVPVGAALIGARLWRRHAAGPRTRWRAGPARWGGPRRVRLHLAIGVAAVAAVAVAVQALQHRPVPPRPGELVVSFLDVGQGDAVLLQRDGSSVLFDTGPPGGPILRRLAEAGVERLDLLVITHAEADHEGMALPVIAAYRPRVVLDGGAGWPTAVQRGLPAALARAGGRAVAARAGQVLRVGAVKLRVLWPPAPHRDWRADGNPNDRAVVAHVQDGPFDLLLPADAESNVTAGLDLPRVEVLKVAHHGSADDGLAAMLERTAPQVAAILVGRNSYGHPAPSTLGALRGVPHLIRTDRDGTVRLRVAGGRMRLEPA